MITIDEHTFNEKLLTKTSKVLDVGCRGFGFARWITENICCAVTAIDADPNIKDPGLPNVVFANCAVTHTDVKEVDIYLFGNGTANYTSQVFSKPAQCEVATVPAYRITPFWDLIKLDCEGAEYGILENMIKPLARQITVEFHEHTPAAKGDAYMQNLFNKLSKWYTIKGLEKKAAHGCAPNFWDVLLTLKPMKI